MGKHKIYTMPFSKVYPLYIAKAEKRGVRKEEVQEPIIRRIRYLDKLIDELAKGKPMEKSLNRI